MERAKQDVTERVGPIEMTVVAAPPTREADDRWQERAEVLANWLLAEWQRESQREAA